MVKDSSTFEFEISCSFDGGVGMRAAVLVIDLVKDTFKHDTPLAHAAREICHKLNPFLSKARQDGHRVVFSTDSFLPGDFIFQGRMSPHSLRGTEGAEIAGELQQDPKDLWGAQKGVCRHFLRPTWTRLFACGGSRWWLWRA